MNILSVPDSTCEDFYALNFCKTPPDITKFLRNVKKDSWYRIDNLLYFPGQPGFVAAYERWVEKNKDNFPLYYRDEYGNVRKQDSNE